mmetsp:Transcript_11015/g.34427  ORF Transcript_11015/g.34427 Transcript_11015/m.34427 type:complete len:101 (+) Transcript_11015:457-759(+)
MELCHELGPGQHYLRDWVEEQGGVFHCNIGKTDKGCSERQQRLIEKWGTKPMGELHKQIARLEGILEKHGVDPSHMTDDDHRWAKERLKIFRQFAQRSEL